MSARAYPIEPRLLTKKQAAAYCGMSLPIFNQVCDVRPIALSENRDRLLRYHTADLDMWIEQQKHPGASSAQPDKMLEKLGGDRGARERH